MSGAELPMLTGALVWATVPGTLIGDRTPVRAILVRTDRIAAGDWRWMSLTDGALECYRDEDLRDVRVIFGGVTTEPPPDRRAEAARWVRQQYADVARAGHPDPLAAAQLEVAMYVRKRSEHLGEVDSLAVLRGAMEALGELMLTGAPTVVTLPDADATTPTTTTDQGGPA